MSKEEDRTDLMLTDFGVKVAKEPLVTNSPDKNLTSAENDEISIKEKIISDEDEMERNLDEIAQKATESIIQTKEIEK